MAAVRRIESHFIEGGAGKIEALLEEPEEAAPLIFLTHLSESRLRKIRRPKSEKQMEEME